MFRAYILAIFRELHVRFGTGESHAAYHSSVETPRCFTFCIKNFIFVEIRVSLNNAKLSSLTKSGVTMPAVFKRNAVK
jgi:hypothetical protein